MKLAMTLRTRLFLSISALITVALLGLLLGLVSVMQMAGTQEALIRDNFVTLDLGLKLRQTLGDQLIIMLGEQPDPAAFEASRQHSLELLDEGIAREPYSEGAQYSFKKAKADYQSLLQAFDLSRAPVQIVSSDGDLTEKFNALRNGLISEQKRALDSITEIERQARERALLIAGLLGLVGVAVLFWWPAPRRRCACRWARTRCRPLPTHTPSWRKKPRSGGPWQRPRTSRRTRPLRQ